MIKKTIEIMKFKVMRRQGRSYSGVGGVTFPGKNCLLKTRHGGVFRLGRVFRIGGVFRLSNLSASKEWPTHFVGKSTVDGPVRRRIYSIVIRKNI